MSDLKSRIAYAMSLGLLMCSPNNWAAPQTTAYLSMYGQTRYAKVPYLPYANPEAPKGGRLVRAEISTFDNLNSMNGKGSYADGIDSIFDSLMSRSLDEPGVMYPLLAEKVTIDPEQSDYIIFHLNPHARFSDGRPVTAEDVKFTFDTYQTKANYGLQMYIANLDKTEVLSKHQVKMTFKGTDNTEIASIVAELAIYSKADWQDKDFTRITLQPIIGSGPYIIDQIDPGRSISYKRDPNYWGRELMVNRGRYNFDQIKYIYFRSSEAAFEAFKTGQYTLHNDKLTRNWMVGYQFPAAKAAMIKKQALQTHNPIPTQSYVFNNRRAPLNDIHLRQALSYAYDFEWLNKTLFFGQNQRLNSYFQNSELEAKGPPSAQELKILEPYLSRLDPLQRQGVLENWAYPVSDGGGFNRDNLLKARQILLDAGYRYQNGRLLDLKDQPIHFEFVTHQQNLQRSILPFIRNAKKLGIQIDLRVVDLPQYMERMRKHDFDITALVMPQSISPGNEQAQMWGSRAADEAGNYNYAGIKNPVLDELIEKLVQSPNREQQVLYTRVIDRVLRAGYYQIMTYNNAFNWYASWDMYQQPLRSPQLSTGIDYWWVDPVKANKVSHYLNGSNK
ncbi:extracellular solute-binding protein [Acinetobacter rudis]|uniref:extracellular solute-binding protein n=1 Tax=Acinetobacter rudis TaxID=632955 RepID=UPI003DA6D683